MIKVVNANQLAFVLDIKVDDARAKMCHAWERSNNINHSTKRNDKGRIIMDYPGAMNVDMLAEQLNIPHLPKALSDIQDNFLKRPGSKKWILCDYPEKELQSKSKNKIKIPTTLASLLSAEDIQLIKAEWSKRYGIQY